MERMIEIRVTKMGLYYDLYINGKRMPELYNEEEIIKSLNSLIRIWSNK